MTARDHAVWDCHVHVIGDPRRFPMTPERRYTPGEAGLDRLRTHLRGVGAGRVVLVQPTIYGADHSCLLNALEALGEMAIAVGAWNEEAPPPDHPRLRGWRIDLRGDWSEAHAQKLSRAAAEAGERHLELQVQPSILAALDRAAGSVRVPIVLDHLAGFPDEAEWPALEHLLNRPGVFVKLSGLERAPGGLAGALPLARRLAARFPDRLVWGSDWPHTPLHPPRADRAAPLPFRSVDLLDTLARLEGALGPSLARSRSDTAAQIYDQPGKKIEIS